MWAGNRIPQIKLTAQPANDFVDNRLITVDQIFEPHVRSLSVSSPQTSCLPVNQQAGQQDDSRKLSQDSIRVPEIQSKQFQKAVAAYERSENGKGSRAIDLVSSSSWSDVLQQLELTREQYNGAATHGFLGNLRGRFRKLADHAVPIEAWLKLLPSQSWQGSLVCGGVMIVLKAAANLGAMREDVCEALESIPESIVIVQRLAHVYSRADDIQLLVDTTCVTVLELLEHIINWYTENPVRKALKAAIKGDAYGKKLETFITKMKRSTDSVERRANVAGHVQSQELSQFVRDSMAVLLNDHQRNKIHQQDLDKVREQLTEARAKAQLRDARECYLLLRLLDHQSDEVLEDLISTVRDGLSVVECQERAAWILQLHPIVRWLDVARSEILIINGAEDSHESPAAISFFTSMLIRALDMVTDFKPVLTLYWFCYQRKNDSVYSMLKSLVCQILDNSRGMETPIEFLQSTSFSIGGMTRFFTECLEVRLRSASVFIILDSLSYYESGERLHDLCWLLQRIAEVVNCPPHSSGYTLKVLVTSPTRFSTIAGRLQTRGGTILEIPAIINDDILDCDDGRLIKGLRERLSMSSIYSQSHPRDFHISS